MQINSQITDKKKLFAFDVPVYVLVIWLIFASDCENSSKTKIY